MIELYKNKQDCCGCTACANICPRNAIEMITDCEGFKYPQINNERCILCGLCQKVCAFQNGYDRSNVYEEPLVYAAKHKDENVRMSSTSGGAFTAISDHILNKNGVIYGVMFDKDMNVIHSKAVTQQERDNFKGSKYVQSDLSDIFAQVANDLVKQQDVLFTGTPCQCAGLLSFLKLHKINIEKLVLCDIVCHGTPSPLLWKNHIEILERKNRSKVRNYYCRSKVKGWHSHTEMVVFENNKMDCKSEISQAYKTIFYSHNALRLSCHNCKYTNTQRCSDITIADYWGIEKTMPDFDDNKGVSLVLINNSRGEKIFNNIKLEFEYRQSNISSCLQPQLQYPTSPSPKRNKFWNDYYKKGYLYVVKKYTNYGLKFRAKVKLVKTLKKSGLYKVAKTMLKRG